VIAFAGEAEAVPLSVLLDPAPMAPATLTVTASTPIDEPILAYAWSGISLEPRCRSKSCPVELPIASCRRVEVTVTDRFGEDTTADAQACATEDGFMPPRARIRIDGSTARAIAEQGDATVTGVELWIDGAPAEGTEAVLAEGCHVIDLLVADAEGRIGVDQRTTCPTGGPRIWVGASPSFCPPFGQPIRVCTEVDDPTGQGLSPGQGGDLPLDTCIERAAPLEPQPMLARGEAGGGAFHGSALGCVSAPGRPTLVFARIDEAYVLARGKTERITVSVDGGEGPFVVQGELRGRGGSTETASVSTSFADLSFDLPANAEITELRVTVSDGRGLVSTASAKVTMSTVPTMPPPSNGISSAEIGCTQASGLPVIALVMPFWILMLRRRR
jgi:hypothetical protein